MELTIIIPCFNEADNISLIVKRFIRCKPKNLSAELLLINNGSSDTSEKEIICYSKKYPDVRYFSIEKNIGYGNGIWVGLQKATGDFLCWTHADMQTDIKECFEAYNMMMSLDKKKTSYIKGERVDGRSKIERLLSFGMEIVEFIILGKYLSEINAQPNLFHKSFIYKLSPPKEWEFELYVYYKARLENFRLIRIPVEWNERIHGTSKWNYHFMAKMKYILKIINYSVKLRYRSFFKAI